MLAWRAKPGPPRPLAMALAGGGRAALEAPAVKRAGPLLVGALRRLQPGPWLRPRPRWVRRTRNRPARDTRAVGRVGGAFARPPSCARGLRVGTGMTRGPTAREGWYAPCRAGSAVPSWSSRGHGLRRGGHSHAAGTR